MSDLGMMIGAIAAGEAPRLGEKVEVDGLEVSTINSCDMGYETAILDANGTYPVERYDTEEEALVGHRRWTAKAATLTTVTELGYGDLWGEREVEVQRVRP